VKLPCLLLPTVSWLLLQNAPQIKHNISVSPYFINVADEFDKIKAYLNNTKEGLTINSGVYEE
jgi:hypothetical protein